jgi:predicted Holliday junction resolvase-like endonuclease
METVFDVYFKEQRHIFGVCPNPECRAVSRLSDIRIAYRGAYLKDWLDSIDDETVSWEEKQMALEEKQKELKQKSIAEARQTILPQRLQSIFSLFRRQRVQPEDIKIVAHPVDFIGFDGLNTSENLKRVILLDSEHNTAYRKDIQQDISRVVDATKYDWSVLRIDENGEIVKE